VADVIGWHGSLGVGRTVTVHMDNTLDHDTLAAALPPGMVVGHDGLEIDLAGGSDGR
jgi:phosphoribosyl 1,2-cyclic phosphate phosphodiesterase